MRQAQLAMKTFPQSAICNPQLLRRDA